jgi:hypothetical protein
MYACEKSSLGKNTVKKTTQVSEHFFKLHFCMFNRSQVKHNSLDYLFFLEMFSIIYKIYISSLTQIKNVFACSKHSNLESGQSLFFFKLLFSTKCAPFLVKIEKDFNIDDYKGKRI